MEQQWCDLELGARRELAGLKDAEWAVINELVQMQWTPDTEQFLLTYQLLSDEIEQGHCFGIALSAPNFTPFLYSSLKIPRPTVSGLPSLRRWASPVLSSWAAAASLGCCSALSCTEKGGKSDKFSPTQCGRMCVVLWPCVFWTWDETQKRQIGLRYGERDR